MNSWPVLACPKDHQPIHQNGERAECPSCDSAYARTGKIWRFLCEGDQHAAFLENYRVIRRGEGWGSIGADYYRRLPFIQASDPQYETWRVRAASFTALLPILGEQQRVLDLGAGNGWLAYQLAQRGHSVAAVDLSDDELDGLGALCHYPVALDAYQASFTALPFADAQFDRVVFNASLHYAEDLIQTVAESLRVLAPEGTLIVVDSPLYQAAASGRAMLEEKRRGLKEHFDLELVGNVVGFLTFADFEKLARTFSLQWRRVKPFVDARWATRHWRARLRGQREPARFDLMIGRHV